MKTNHLLIALMLFVVLLLAGCGGAQDAPVQAVPEGAQAGDLIELQPCTYEAGDTKYSADCGTLIVPENWDKADSRLIRLPVVRIPASGQGPAEPVFYLAGGPGAPNLIWSPPDWLLEDHDVVMVGYRGTEGTVVLACPEVNRLLKAHMGKDLFSGQARAEYMFAVEQCAATYQEAGVDLSGYTIPGVIEDMEAARNALGYDRINLYSLSFGTRIAQIYAYLHPDSLHRLVLIGVNTPGHFIWEPAVFDKMVEHISELCAQDAACSSRTSDFAQTMYAVNHNMPKRWLFFNIDPDTVRLSTHFAFMSNPSMPMIFEAYLAAAEGDPSGLAMMNLMASSIMPADRPIIGDSYSKGGTIDSEKYGGIESISLGDSIMGAPLSELIWPMGEEWPTELIPKELREFQESDVEMLLINGTVDFSTPPTALDEARPYFHKAQMLLLPEFSHTDDMTTLQPEAFERLITSYYDTGAADDSLFVYQPLPFKSGMSVTVVARLLIAAIVLVPALAILGVVAVVRRNRKRSTVKSISQEMYQETQIRRKKMNTQLIVKRSMMILLTLATLFSLVTPVMARADKAAQDENVFTAPSQGQGPTDSAELEAFLDDLFAKDMEENHIAGAAVAVVKDGKLFFTKGYGYADLENDIPVDPEKTIFAVGSVSKVFTWTAVMQLVEQGKLDLDADVNTYLDFRIPDTYPQPITLKHLLTHTSGFEQRLLGSLVTDPNDLMPVREGIISYMPARVRPPGEAAGYSNYNAMLAGYIVARVSGQPYDQYLQEHVFNPLGMVHSTAQWPIPPDLRPYASLGYAYGDGAFQVFPDYTGQAAGLPSGAVQASVTDMARFMIAHLQGGSYSDANIAAARILKESTVQQMHSTLYTPDPRLLGMAYGFSDYSDNGQRTLGHSGYLPPMRSELLLLPDQNLGVFVAYNTDVEVLARQHFGFQRAFFDHYFPASAAEPIRPPADFAERAGRFVGSYGATDGSDSTLIKIIELGDAVKISDSGDGALVFRYLGREWRFVEVEPLYFRQADGPFHIFFREDDRGNITHMFFDVMPFRAFEKLDWYESPGFHMMLALGCVLVFLTMIPVAVIRFIRDRRLGSDRKPASRGARVAYRIILGISVLNLLFLVGIALGIPAIMQNLLLDPPLIMKIALGLGVLSALLTVGALVYTALAWKDGYWGVAFRIYYTLVTVAAVAFVWFLHYWNWLGWRY